MLNDDVKKFAVLGAFVVLGLAAIYVFSLFTGEGGQPEAAEQQQPSQPQPVKVGLPEGVAELMCSKYANLPAGMASCGDALKLVAKNFSSNIVSFSLLYKTPDGQLLQPSQPLPGGASPVWLASFITERQPANSTDSVLAPGSVVLDAKNLSVIRKSGDGEKS